MSAMTLHVLTSYGTLIANPGQPERLAPFLGRRAGRTLRPARVEDIVRETVRHC